MTACLFAVHAARREAELHRVDRETMAQLRQALEAAQQDAALSREREQVAASMLNQLKTEVAHLQDEVRG